MNNETNTTSLDVKATQFLKELPISNEQKCILSKIIAILMAAQSTSIIGAVLESIFGDSIEDERTKKIIMDTVRNHVNSDNIADSIYNCIKVEEDD